MQSRREIRRGPRIQMHRRDSPDIVLLFFTFRNIGEFLLGPSTVRGFSYITSYIAVHVHLRTHRGTRAHRQSGHGKDLFIGGPLPSSLSYKSGCVCQRRARAVARANSTRAKRRILPMSVQHLFSCKNNLRIEKQRETFLSVPLVFDQYENGEHHSFVLAQFTGGAHNPVYTVYRECNKRLWRRLTCLFSPPSLPHARTWRPFRCSPSARRRPRRFRWLPRGRCCGG